MYISCLVYATDLIKLFWACVRSRYYLLVRHHSRYIFYFQDILAGKYMESTLIICMCPVVSTSITRHLATLHEVNTIVAHHSSAEWVSVKDTIGYSRYFFFVNFDFTPIIILLPKRPFIIAFYFICFRRGATITIAIRLIHIGIVFIFNLTDDVNIIIYTCTSTTNLTLRTPTTNVVH